jgi:transporter family protein
MAPWLIRSRRSCSLRRASIFTGSLLIILATAWADCRRVSLTILIYLGVLWFSGRWNQKFSSEGFYYSALTGICVGAGTIAFFLLFQKGGPLSSVPAILAGGAAIMAIAGMLFFREPASWQRLVGITLAIAGLFLLRK